MITRWLDETDLTEWRRHRSEALHLFPEAFLTTYADFQAQSDEAVRKSLSHRKMLGVFIGETLVASGALLQKIKPQTKHRAEIAAFYVAKVQHGKGTADFLMTKLITQVISRDVGQLELFVWEGNTRAIAFYARHGFEKMGRLPAAVIVDGDARDDLFMVKPL